MIPNTSAPRYFFSLDAIRGLACIVVVIFHWQFFFYTDDAVMSGALADLPLPLYSWLAIFYNHAILALDLFFLLSGFIFFWFYADKVASRKTSFNNFMGYRFTRLLPVHLLTLVALAVLQSIMLHQSGHYFIIQNNDTYHFILNLFLIHSWGFESTPALNGFNGPSWSVSVEVLLYLVFFLLCRYRLHYRKGVLIGVILVGVVIQYFYSMIGQGIYSFFLGGIVYYLYTWIIAKRNAKKIAIVIAAIALLLWMVILTEYAFSYIRTAFMFILQKVLPSKGADFDTGLFNLARKIFLRTVISPISVLSLALLETTRGSFHSKWMLSLGHASYAMYLLHFPLMVFFVIMADALGVDRSIFQSPFMLLFFFSVLLPLSLMIHYNYEVPVQETLRRRLIKKTLSPVNVVNREVIT